MSKYIVCPILVGVISTPLPQDQVCSSQSPCVAQTGIIRTSMNIFPKQSWESYVL